MLEMPLAHGLGGRSDLPVPLWLAIWAGAAAVLVSFVAMSLLWTTSRLRGADAGRALPGFVQTLVRGPATAVVVRVLAAVAVLTLVAVAWFGPDSSAENPAPTWFYVWFWVGGAALAALTGIAVDGRRGTWFATAGLAAFLWLELAFPYSDSPRVVAVFVAVYAIVRPGGFAEYFRLFARLAPFGIRSDGRAVVRNPLDGLLTGRAVPLPIVLLVLGATTFDGLSRLPLWTDTTGDLSELAATAANTAGLAGTVALVALGYAGAVWLTKPYLRRDAGDPHQAFAHSLIPVTLGYTVAHYFSFFVFQGQAGITLLLDNARIDYGVVGTTTIAVVQIGAIVAGHVMGVISAHDRAVAVLRPGYVKVGQFPMLALMVVYTMVGIQLVASA